MIWEDEFGNFVASMRPAQKAPENDRAFDGETPVPPLLQ